jgi:hypothetical protein
MSWKDKWPERVPRPKAAKLSPEKRDAILKGLVREKVKSPVLVALGVEVCARRGRFYLEMDDPEEPGKPFGMARITPLAEDDGATLLLEVERSTWSEVARGGIVKVMNAVSGDREGRFHGLGALDRALRKRGLERQPLVEDEGRFKYGDGKKASVQEVLFHHFGVPIPVIAEPSEWYAYHRVPVIIEHDVKRERVLVEFRAFDWMRGEEFGGMCIYAMKDGAWGAYTVRPNASASIETAEAWLKKRGWKAW